MPPGSNPILHVALPAPLTTATQWIAAHPHQPNSFIGHLWGAWRSSATQTPTPRETTVVGLEMKPVGEPYAGNPHVTTSFAVEAQRGGMSPQRAADAIAACADHPIPVVLDLVQPLMPDRRGRRGRRETGVPKPSWRSALRTQLRAARLEAGLAARLPSVWSWRLP